MKRLGSGFGRRLGRGDLIGLMLAAAIVAIAVGGWWRPARVADDGARRLAAPGGPTTTRTDLTATIAAAEQTLAAHPLDRGAAILLGDAAIRQARVTGDTGLTARAVVALEPVVAADPADYEARRMLATIYASEHRFADALRHATRLRDERPDDPWNYGIIGDAHVERGEYDAAFAAFQRMLDIKTSAAAYARVAYGFELRGQLDDAIAAMKLAVDAASPRDPESIAWLNALLAELYLDLGQLPQARLALAWAETAFPNHPTARATLGKLQQAEGDLPGATRTFEALVASVGLPDYQAALGDLYLLQGRDAEAERAYEQAEAQWRRSGLPEQAHLARFLAEHDRALPEARRLAETRESDDIFTQDARAWSAFKTGDLDAAVAAQARALRTGSRHAEILAHAAVIQLAAGRPDAARALAGRIPPGSLRFPRAGQLLQPVMSRLAGGPRPERTDLRPVRLDTP